MRKAKTAEEAEGQRDEADGEDAHSVRRRFRADRGLTLDGGEGIENQAPQDARAGVGESSGENGLVRRPVDCEADVRGAPG